MIDQHLGLPPFSSVPSVLSLSLCAFTLLVSFLSVGQEIKVAQKRSSSSAKYGYASACELEFAKFYCHIAPHDNFCKGDTLSKCITLKVNYSFEAFHFPHLTLSYAEPIG